MKIKNTVALRYSLYLFYVPLCLSEEWIIIEDVGLEHEYSELRALVATAEDPINKQRIEGDEFFNKTSSQLSAVCAQLKNAKIYQRLPSIMREFPEPVDLEGASREMDSVYSFRTLKTFLGTYAGEIPVFPCETHENRIYWLTYAYSNRRLFLLREVDNGAAVSFVGESEPIPRVNERYPRGDFLDSYFLATLHKSDEVRATKGNPFLSSAQYRLCCLVHAARQKAHPELAWFTLNYANTTLRPRFDAYEFKFNEPQFTAIVDGKTLGCVVNRKVVDNIQFYLHSDYMDATGVFVFEKIEESDKTKLALVERVGGISIQNRYAILLI